jgi:hypothetical protein
MYGEKINAYRILEGKCARKLGVNGRIVLKCILKEQDGKVQTGFTHMQTSGGLVSTALNLQAP